MKIEEIQAETVPEGADVILFSGKLLPKIDKDIVNFVVDIYENKKLYFILCTSGGSADSAYLIARKLDSIFDDFIILVNGECKSAGTLLALGANELIVTSDAEFGPLDVQIFSPDEFVKRSSGLTITQAMQWINEQAVDTFEEIFLSLRSRSDGAITTKTAGDIACNIVGSLYSTITDKIDPAVIGEMKRATDVAIKYGELLGIPHDLITDLVKDYPSHDFVIDYKEAIEKFLNCRFIKKNEVPFLCGIQEKLREVEGEDFTSIPSEEGYLARFSLDLEDQKIDPNGNSQSKDSLKEDEPISEDEEMDEEVKAL